MADPSWLRCTRSQKADAKIEYIQKVDIAMIRVEKNSAFFFWSFGNFSSAYIRFFLTLAHAGNKSPGYALLAEADR